MLPLYLPFGMITANSLKKCIQAVEAWSFRNLMFTSQASHDEERHGSYGDAWKIEGDVRSRNCTTNSKQGYMVNQHW